MTGMIDDVVADVFGLCVQLHDRLLKDLHFVFNIDAFLVHASAFFFCLAQ
jgi:hypothetical protein